MNLKEEIGKENFENCGLFDNHAAETPAKFQSELKTEFADVTALRLCKIL